MLGDDSYTLQTPHPDMHRSKSHRTDSHVRASANMRRQSRSRRRACGCGRQTTSDERGRDQGQTEHHSTETHTHTHATRERINEERRVSQRMFQGIDDVRSNTSPLMFCCCFFLTFESGPMNVACDCGSTLGESDGEKVMGFV